MDPADFCEDSLGLLPQGSEVREVSKEGGLWGEAVCAGLPCLHAPPSPHTHPGLCRAEGRREATQGRTRLPAACTAGADLNPLPESEGTLSASAERIRGCPGFWERLGQQAELAKLLMPRKEGAGEAAKAGWGRRGRASWGRS